MKTFDPEGDYPLPGETTPLYAVVLGDSRVEVVDMSDDIVTPALRSGELRDGIDIGRGLIFANVEGDELVIAWRSTNEEEPIDRRHALAALALHGQPFGFTRQMADAVVACAEYEMIEAGVCPVCGADVTGQKLSAVPILLPCGHSPRSRPPGRDESALALKAALLIAALLPPETPKAPPEA